jgi:hypothetical protein
MTDDSDVSRESVLDHVTGQDVERRGVLGGAAATVTAALGFSGTAAARSDQPVGFHDYVSVPAFGADAFEEVLGANDDMLAALADRGLLDARSAADLDLDGLRTDAVGVQETDGSVTPELRVTRDLDDGRTLTLGFRPERDMRYALVGSGDGPTPIQDVTTMSCCDCCSLEYVCCTSACDSYCWECTCPDDCC